MISVHECTVLLEWIDRFEALSEQIGLSLGGSAHSLARMRNPFRYFNSSPQVIRLTVMMYSTSISAVAATGRKFAIRAGHRYLPTETVRFWWNRFGPMFAATIRKRRVDLSERQLDARRRVHGALEASGGFGGPGASCLWHVLGCGCSIREWALRRGWCGRSVDQKEARGILIAALGMLAGQYGYSEIGGRPLPDRRAGIGSSDGDHRS